MRAATLRSQPVSRALLMGDILGTLAFGSQNLSDWGAMAVRGTLGIKTSRMHNSLFCKLNDILLGTYGTVSLTVTEVRSFLTGYVKMVFRQ